MDDDRQIDDLQLLLLGIELRAHRDLIVEMCREARLEPNGKDASLFLQERIEKRLDELLAKLSDVNPSEASALKKLYEESKRLNG